MKFSLVGLILIVFGSILILCSNFIGINITGCGRFKFKNNVWRVLSYLGWILFVFSVSIQFFPGISSDLSSFP